MLDDRSPWIIMIIARLQYFVDDDNAVAVVAAVVRNNLVIVSLLAHCYCCKLVVLPPVLDKSLHWQLVQHVPPNVDDKIEPLWYDIVVHAATSHDDSKSPTIVDCPLPTFAKLERATNPHPYRPISPWKWPRHSCDVCHCSLSTRGRRT